MNSSPPKSSASSRPPSALGGADGGRRITALAAGGSVLLLSVAAVALWPRTYGTEATFVVEGGDVPSASALAGKVEATLLEREELARAAIELPPELRSPDPIGRLRAGIRVQSRGPLGYIVEFRGSEPKSVQRIANLLAERAVSLVPKLAAAPQDQAPAQILAARTRAVAEFLTTHPEVTVDASGGGKASPTSDSGLEALRTEKRQLEQRLTTGATDNPYAEPDQTPEVLNRRLTEIKSTIARREKALKDLKEAKPATAVSPDLVAQWRQLLADLSAAQAAASAAPAAAPPVTARITARAPLPTSPITPNRFVLSIVALLLSVAAALVAYVLPRKPEPVRRGGPRSTRPALAPGVARSEPPRPRSEPPRPRSEPPIPRSDPPPPLALGPAPTQALELPPPPRPASDPPPAIAVQRTVVVSGPTGASPRSVVPPGRSHTAPGGLEAPALSGGASAIPPAAAPPSPLFGSRPPPGAGSYSVSSSHPPPMDRAGAGRTSVERLSPLQSARPPDASAAIPSVTPTRRSISPLPPAASVPQIVSRPPALDPEAESWAAHFEAPPPPAEPTRPTHPQPTPPDADEGAPRRRAGRWKTQAMGSMVPLEVMAVREELAPPSTAIESVRSSRPLVHQVQGASATTIVHYDVPVGWSPQVTRNSPDITQLRDAVLQAATGRSVTLLVTGTARAERAQLASGLALSLAEAGARTLLVEADFDNPQLHRVLSLSAPANGGFSQQLMARRNARRPEPWTVMRCSSNLGVLPEGRFRSPGLVVTREFESALADLSVQHHIVLVHAPALSQPDDLRPLGGLADGVVLVEPGKPSELRFGENPLSGLV